MSHVVAGRLTMEEAKAKAAAINQISPDAAHAHENAPDDWSVSVSIFKENSCPATFEVFGFHVLGGKHHKEGVKCKGNL